MDHLQGRAELCEIARRLWNRGLVGAAEGNVSLRLSTRQILCTPTGCSLGHLKPSDLVVIDNHGKPIGAGTPSSEIKLHVRILAKRPDCQAVIHAHPPIATAFALAGEDIPDNLMPEAAYVLGSVATVPFCMPGTNEVPDAIEPLLEDHKTFLMSHHGAVVLGKDLTDAFNRIETLERIAKVILVAKQLGGPVAMPERAFSQLLKSAMNGKLG
jgi:L-fuculose-phosphate aldolase